VSGQGIEPIGPWRLIRVLGQGGNATVWEATRGEAENSVALKVVNSRKAEREPYRRFVKEAEVLRSRGAQPGVLPLLDAYLPERPSAAGRPWLAMPIALTKGVGWRLRRKQAPKTPRPHKRAQACRDSARWRRTPPPSKRCSCSPGVPRSSPSRGSPTSAHRSRLGRTSTPTPATSRQGSRTRFDPPGPRFRLDRQRFQPVHIEALCEAEGLAPRLARIAGEFGVNVYPSAGFDGLKGQAFVRQAGA
jgi:hypothetical protein